MLKLINLVEKDYRSVKLERKTLYLGNLKKSVKYEQAFLKNEKYY
jgi:hypothetical protein